MDYTQLMDEGVAAYEAELGTDAQPDESADTQAPDAEVDQAESAPEAAAEPAKAEPAKADVSKETSPEAPAKTDQADQAEKPTEQPSRPWRVVLAEGQTEPPGLDALKLAFKADGKEVEKDVPSLVREAQQTPMLRARVTELMQQRQSLDTDLLKAQAELSEANELKRTWQRILGDETGQSFLDAQLEYRRALGQPDPVEQAPAQTQDQLDQAGVAYYQQHIVPWVRQQATAWSMDGKAPSAEHAQHLEQQITQAFLTLAGQEGRHLTPQRLQTILDYDIPTLIAEGGYVQVRRAEQPGQPVSKASSSAPDPEKAALRAELERAKTLLAQNKLDQAPDAGVQPGSRVPGAAGLGTDLSKAKSWQDIKNMLSDPDETFGM